MYSKVINQVFSNKRDDIISNLKSDIQNKLTKDNIVSFLPYYEYFYYNNKRIINHVLYLFMNYRLCQE